MANTRQDAGRIGGLQTSLRYGREHFSEIGKLGGRPKLIERQEAVPEAQNKNGGWLPTSLKELKELWKQRREENGVLVSDRKGNHRELIQAKHNNRASTPEKTRC